MSVARLTQPVHFGEPDGFQLAPVPTQLAGRVIGEARVLLPLVPGGLIGWTVGNCANAATLLSRKAIKIFMGVKRGRTARVPNSPLFNGSL